MASNSVPRCRTTVSFANLIGGIIIGGQKNWTLLSIFVFKTLRGKINNPLSLSLPINFNWFSYLSNEGLVAKKPSGIAIASSTILLSFHLLGHYSKIFVFRKIPFSKKDDFGCQETCFLNPIWDSFFHLNKSTHWLTGVTCLTLKLWIRGKSNTELLLALNFSPNQLSLWPQYIATENSRRVPWLFKLVAFITGTY